jgi:hypothetical protein
MTFAVVKSEKDYTPWQRVMAGRSPGRRTKRLPGGHIADRAALRKAITLCRDCLPKFNANAVEYVTKPNLPFVRGRCDGCQDFTPRGHLLVHYSLADLT